MDMAIGLGSYMFTLKDSYKENQLHGILFQD